MTGRSAADIKSFIIVCAFAALLLIPNSLLAETASRAKIDSHHLELSEPTTPSDIGVGSMRSPYLKLVTFEQNHELNDQVTRSFILARAQLTKSLGKLPKFKATVKMLREADFFRETKAPRWASALFVGGEIIVPVSQQDGANKRMNQSIAHEYVHAVVAEISNSNCPGWIDEGLAQLFEGGSHDKLLGLFTAYVSRSGIIPMVELQTGFTKLSKEKVAAAYGQSLLATKYLLSLGGWKALRSYLDLLKAGGDSSEAFKAVYGVTERQFQKDFAFQLGIA